MKISFLFTLQLEHGSHQILMIKPKNINKLPNEFTLSDIIHHFSSSSSYNRYHHRQMKMKSGWLT